MSYVVKEIFYTLQGEGIHAGRPAVFLRFSEAFSIGGVTRAIVDAEEDMPRIYKTTPPEERFWNKVTKTKGCWVWTGAIAGGSG